MISESLTSDDPDLDDYDDTFTYDLVGNRVEYIHDSVVNTNDKTITYTYDDNDRLLTEKQNVDGTANDRFLVYTYDETQQTGKTVHAGLDASGTVQESTTNTYNLQGRLSEVDFDPDGDTGSAAHKITKYEYDDAGFRVLKDVDGAVTRYLADANNHTGYTQVLEETDAAGALQKSFLLGHDVIAQFDTTDGLVYLVYDGHGSTRQLINSSGTIVTPAGGIAQVFTYNAYGESLGFEEPQAITALLYSGEWFDAEVGWQYNRARWYDPTNGRWNRLDDFAGRIRDPLSLHKYLYVHGDPIGGIDPSGRFFTAVGSLGVSTIQSIIRNPHVAASLAALDKASTFADAVKIVGALATGGPISPGLLAGFLVSVLPFGNILAKASIAGKKLVGVADELTDVLSGLRQAGLKGNSLIARVGEFGAIATAKKLGFEAIENFPTRHTGIDGLFRNGNKLVIVEAKGGLGRLAKTQHGSQMSKRWIRQKADELRDLGYTKWADEILEAARTENIQGLVVTTGVENGTRALDPVFELRDWVDIGIERFIE